MALPKLLQKLFDDEGKGPKLNPSIIPTKINGQEPDETGEFNLQLSDPDAATRPEILTAVKKVTEASEVTFEPDESLPSVGHNIGEEWVSYLGMIPEGGVPYCGQLVTREVYRDLWEYAQTQGLVKTEAEWQQIATANNGNVPFYSSGDGSTTFRVPKLVGYVKGASSQSESGSYIAEGLPNITGTYSALKTNDDDIKYFTGAFSFDDTAKIDGAAGDGYDRLGSFDASRSNPIYGNSDHVTPETSTVMFGVYAFGAIVETGALDATTLATAIARVESNLEAKVDKTSAHIVETWSSGTSWYRKWSDGWIEQGGNTTSSSSTATTTLPTAFSDTNYTVVATSKNGSSGSNPRYNVSNKKTTTFDVWFGSYSTYAYEWYACGY